MWSRRSVLAGSTALLLAPSAALAGTAAPFQLRNVLGASVSLADFAGQVVVLSFWATWCGPCKVEMRHLHALHQKLNGSGLTVLFISIDDARAGMSVKQYVKKMTYQEDLFLLDPQSEVVARYNPNKGVPYSVLIARSGAVVKTWEGFNPGEEVVLEQAVEAELAKSA